MLEFKQAFPKGSYVHHNYNNIQTILKCKNIAFDHIDWFGDDRSAYNNVDLMFHLIDNIVDIDVTDRGSVLCFTFFTKIIRYTNNLAIIHHLLNTRCIQHSYFGQLGNYQRQVRCVCCQNKHFDKLVNYLDSVSLSKFKGYYNLEKYYDMLYIMLLVMKAQRRLPTAIIKHLIIPFIYH